MPRQTQIVNCVRTLLSPPPIGTLTAGDEYNFTPGIDSKRVKHWLTQDLGAGKGADVLYFVRLGRSSDTEDMTGAFEREMELFILGAKVDERGSDNPFEEPEPTRGEYQDQLSQDIRNRLSRAFADPGSCLQNLVDNLGPAIENRDFFYPPWAIIEIRFLIEYEEEVGGA